MTSKPRAVGYCRVSTDEQDVSLDAQEDQIRAMAVVKGFDLIEIVKDKVSGKSLDREGVKRVLEMIRQRRVEAVIITKMDRMTRSTRDVIELVELMNRKKVSLVSLAESLDTDSPTGQFFIQLITALGELERKTIGVRTRTAMGHMRKIGLPVGRPPYGYRSPGKKVNYKVPLSQKLPLVIDPEEQKLVKRILDLREREGLSLRRIAARLNKEGVTTRKGSTWKHQYIDALLRRMGA
jgi:site-specific DNA recombinase